MMLFKPKHVRLILDNTKTETRRLWTKPRARVGSLHKCYSGGLPISKCADCGGTGGFNTGRQDDPANWTCSRCHGTGKLQPFATIRILDVWQERLGSISEQDAIAEGYMSVGDYLLTFMGINKIAGDDVNEALERQVYAIKFELVDGAKG